MRDRIAFLGLGIMGGCMAANLARSGNNVTGWNRTAGKPGVQVAEEAGVKIAATAREAIASASVVFVCLGDVDDITELLFGEAGIAQHLERNAIVVDMSTTGPACAKDLAQKLAGRGLRFVDAPVSGGDVGAKLGTLTIMAGGERADFDELQPFFKSMGKNIFYCGAVGSGQAVKLCNQILCAVNMVAVCESLELAEELNIDPQLVVDVCSTGAAGSWALANLGPRILKSDYGPGFMLKHMLKDLRLVMESIGNQPDVLPGTTLAIENFKEASGVANSAGLEQGTQSMMRVYREV